MRRHGSSSLFVSLLAVFLSSCGGGGDPAPATPNAPPATVSVPQGSTSPIVETTIQRYPVEGRTVEEVRASIDARGPRTPNGRSDARTRWTLQWSSDIVETPEGVRAAQGRVTVTTVIILPEWTPPPDVAPGLVDRWERYATAIRAHEENHLANGVRAGSELLARIAAAPPAATAEELRKAIDAAKAEAIARGATADIDYDYYTDYGRREGIRL